MPYRTRRKDAMTLDKAIFELEDGLRQLRGYLNKDYNDAIQLGIEALKKVKAVRDGREWVGINLLPGETKE